MLVIMDNLSPPVEAARLPVRGGLHTLIDEDLQPYLSRFRWFLLKSAHNKYVATRRIRNGKAHTVRLHRLITRAPASMKVHHINHNPLDNRRSNLLLVTEREHRHFDGWHIFRK